MKKDKNKFNLTNKAKKMIQKAYVDEYYSFFWVLIYGLNGLCFNMQAQELLAMTTNPFRNLVNDWEVIDLIEFVSFQNRKIIKAKSGLYDLVEKSEIRQQKLTNATARNLVESATFAELYLQDFEWNNLDELADIIKDTTMQFKNPKSYAEVLNQINRDAQVNLEVVDTSNLRQQFNYLQERRKSIINNEKLNKNKESRGFDANYDYRYEDLFTLSHKGIYLKQTNYFRSEDKTIKIFNPHFYVINNNIQPKKLYEKCVICVESAIDMFNFDSSGITTIPTIRIVSLDKINNINKLLEYLRGNKTIIGINNKAKMINNKSIFTLKDLKALQKVFNNIPLDAIR